MKIDYISGMLSRFGVFFSMLFLLFLGWGGVFRKSQPQVSKTQYGM